jgi:hypothetical protein
VILGIDPGASTGLAFFRDGKLSTLETIAPHEIAGVIKATAPARVIFEDSRLQSHVWTTASSKAAALKMARNIGQIDAWCTLITAVCADLGIPAHGISPTAKGAKVKAEAFVAATGWTGRANQHERDAAMVAWKYRGAR